MTDIHFYHLTSTSLDNALPKLLAKVLDAGLRAVVHVSSEEEAERLNGWLWTWQPDSFLPHGTARDGHGDAQPIYLTHGQENPNQAQVLIVASGQRREAFEGYERVLDIFDGSDDAQAAEARARWKHYSAAGHSLAYVKQSESGAWEKQGG